MAERIGLLAGHGRLPLYAARGIKAAGYEPVVIGLAEEVQPELETEAPFAARVSVAEIDVMADLLRRAGVSRLVMAGKVHKPPLFAGTLAGPDLQELLRSLPRKNDDAILGAVVDYFQRKGLTVLAQTEFLQDHLVPKGVYSRRPPDPREMEDIVFGFEMAKGIGRLDFGQSVVVKDLAVLAVEAIEGTDETIRRGGRFGRGGAVLVKVSKPQQDARFDVPTVGLDTIAAMLEAGVSTLAIEAGETFFLDRAASLALADRNNLAVVAVGNNGLL